MNSQDLKDASERNVEPANAHGEAPERSLLAEIRMTNGATVRFYAERWAAGRAPSLRIERVSTKGSVYGYLISPVQRLHVVAAVQAWAAECEAVGCSTSQARARSVPGATSRDGGGR